MVSTSKKVIIAYGIGVLGFIILINTPFSVPCVFKLIFGLPCPGCGLFRALVLVTRLDIVGAARMNIIALPLFIGGAAYFVCAVIEATTHKPAISRFNAIMAKKWVIASAALLMVTSWVYNLVSY